MEVDPHDAYKAYVEDAMNERAEELALRGSGKEVIDIYANHTSQPGVTCHCEGCQRDRKLDYSMRNI